MNHWCATTALAKEIADTCGCACSANKYTTPAIMRPFIASAAAKAVSLVERVFMGVSGKWLSSILTCITQQGPCQLQKPGKKGHLEGHFHRMGRQVTPD